MKARLTLASILIVAEQGVGYTIYFDVSKDSLGYVLMQQENTVAYGSRQLKIYENNYLTHNLELVVVVFSLKS